MSVLDLIGASCCGGTLVLVGIFVGFVLAMAFLSHIEDLGKIHLTPSSTENIKAELARREQEQAEKAKATPPESA